MAEPVVRRGSGSQQQWDLQSFIQTLKCEENLIDEELIARYPDPYCCENQWDGFKGKQCLKLWRLNLYLRDDFKFPKHAKC
jgi:hypothetical protein